MELQKSTSFLQTHKHAIRSKKFQHVRPNMLEELMGFHGFNLVELQTGKARLDANADHQTTVARYRSKSEFKINGLHLDIVAKIPHLYGAIELFLGTYRLICRNGLVAGTKFEAFRIPHMGDPSTEINRCIPHLVAQESKLIAEIQEMQATKLSSVQMKAFAQRVANERLSDKELVEVKFEQLLQRRREEDWHEDLFTTMNVIQENSLRYSMDYTIKIKGTDETRNMTTRTVNPSSAKAVSINRMVWDAATLLLRAS